MKRNYIDEQGGKKRTLTREKKGKILVTANGEKRKKEYGKID